MFCQSILQQANTFACVKVAVIGAGQFGSGIISQAAWVPAVQIVAVADADLAAARQAYMNAGIPLEQIRCCQTPHEARTALNQHHRIITQDAGILFNLPLDLIAEATGIPEAGARHAQQAIAQGKHVAMVTKEADAAVGPMLKYLADQAGVVYSAVEGDQHGMLIGLVMWARMLGMEVLCGGKALDGELILNSAAGTLRHYDHTLALSPTQGLDFAPLGTADHLRAKVAARAEALGEIAGAKPWDLVELTIAANATQLVPDIPALHCPACWTSEIPELLCPRELGGLLQGTGRIDAVQVLRQEHEASLGGGVFVVVRSRGEGMQKLLAHKGITCHRQGSTALLMRPHHLLGIEAIGTILAASFAQMPTGALDYLPRFDVVYRAKRNLNAQELVGNDHSPALTAEIVPAVRLSRGNPLPAGLARDNRLCCDVPAGQYINYEMVQRPAESTLWSLRDAMEKQFRI